MGTAMKIQRKLAGGTPRNTVQLAWALAGVAEAIRGLGERLEQSVDGHGIDILATVEPLVQRRVAG
jgi:hypothetical protein